MKKAEADPDDHLATLPDDARQEMIVVDGLITAAMPGRRRVLWEGTFWGGTDQTIIGYGDLVQPRSRGGDVEWFIVGLARQKTHMSVYVNAVQGDTSLVAQFADQLGGVKTGAASITIRRLAELDLPAFARLLAAAHDLCPADR